MIDQELIEKFYSKFFTIPRKRITVSIGLATIALASLLNGTVSKSFFAQRYLFIGLGLIICIFIAAFALKMALNSRRIFFLSLFILIFVEIFDFIVIHIINNFNLIIMAPATMAAGLTLILFFTSESSEIRTAIISASILIAIYPVNFIFSFEAPHRFLSYFITIIVGIFFAFLFVKYIDRNYGGINIKKILRSFLLFWLTSEPSYFEKELFKTSLNKKGWVRCLKVGDVRLVSTSFHPGPLRNIGGAMLVGKILNTIENSIYLHSPAKHDSNPTSAADVEKIVEALNCEFPDEFSNKTAPYKPIEVEGEKFTLKIFPFDGVKLLFISGRKAIDDIPEDVYRLAEEILGECMIVDCHNCHKSNYEVTSEDLVEIKELVEKASKHELRRIKNLRYFFFKRKIETANTCGHIAMLLLDYDGERHALLMLDGNNVDCSFKNELESFFFENGYKGIITSTDNHAKTAISPKVGYMPVGSDRAEREAILDFIGDCIRNGIRDIKAEFREVDEIGYSKKEVEVKVMGNNFFKYIERAFQEIGEKAMYLFFAVIILQLAVSILLGNLIM
jgi:putative membrane protein